VNGFNQTDSMTFLFNKKQLFVALLGLISLVSVGFLLSAAVLPYGAVADNPQVRIDLVPSEGGVFNPFIEGHVDISGNTASVDVTNTSGIHTYSIHMASYEVFKPMTAPDFISTQVIFDSNTQTIAPGETLTLATTLPNCNYQVDFFEGPNVPQANPDFGAEPLATTHTILDWRVETSGQFCGDGEEPTQLILQKTVVNNNGGTNTAQDFTLWFYNIANGSGSRTETHTGVTHTVAPGTYQVGEIQLPGYAQNGGWFVDCTINGRVTLVAGETKRCRVVNDDISEQEPTPELSIEKTGPTTVRPGQVITYRITVTNTGDVPISADDYRIVDRVEPPLTYLHGTPNCAFQANQGGSRGRVVCDGDSDLDPGEKTAFQLTFRVDATASCELGFTNKADVQIRANTASGWVSIDWGMQASTVICVGETEPELSIEKTGPTTVRPGQVATYRLTVTNTGTIAVPTYVVTDEVPNELTFLRGTPNCAIASGVVSCASPNELKAGENQVFQIVFRVDREDELSNCPLTFTNRGVVTAPGTTDSDDTTTTIVCGGGECIAPILSLPDGGALTGRVGDSLSYTWGVSGTGPINTTISGTLPAGLTFDPTTRTISGTPTETTDGGSVSITIRATNECGNDTAVLTIIIVGQNQCIPPVLTAPGTNTEVTGHVGQNFSYEIAVSSTSPYTIMISSLPAGLSYNQSTQRIEGTPTQTGSFAVTVSVANTDDVSCIFSQEMVITILGNGCTVNCGGGGLNPPTVVLFGNPTTNPLASASFVFLSQVPYTGIGLDVLQATLFLIGLLVISAIAAYGVMHSGGKLRGFTGILARLKNAFVEAYTVPVVHKGVSHREELPQEDMRTVQPITASLQDEYEAQKAYERYAHENESTSLQENTQLSQTEVLTREPSNIQVLTQHEKNTPIVEKNENITATASSLLSLSVIENVARESKVLVSEKAGEMILAQATHKEHAKEVFGQILTIAQGKYPRENGWLVLDEERTREAFFISAIGMVPLFIGWLTQSEDKKIFTFLRRLHGQKQPIADFMRAVVTELDNVHQARLEGTSDMVDRYTLNALEKVATKELEELIGILLRGVDERYRESFTSARLALVRALDSIQKNKLEKSGSVYTGDAVHTV
jgi:uncharacterized repeat protein (TIGR01451 family)